MDKEHQDDSDFAALPGGIFGLFIIGGLTSALILSMVMMLFGIFLFAALYAVQTAIPTEDTPYMQAPIDTSIYNSDREVIYDLEY